LNILTTNFGNGFYHSFYGNVNYRILKPNELFNSFTAGLTQYYEFDNRTGMLQTNRLNLVFNTENKKNDFLGFAVNTRPFLTYDFYEPRSENEKRFVQIPEQIQFYFFLSQNYNRKLAIDFNPYFTFLNERERVVYNIFFSPRYRRIY
jgi:hypothetical protein